MLIILSVFLFSVFSGLQSLNADTKKLVKGEMFSDKSAFSVGDTISVGINIQIAPGWHIYWKVSGDAGFPTEIDWKIPLGFKSGAEKWPLPKKFTEQETLVVYGYEKQVVFIKDVIVPASGMDLDLFEIEATVSWLACKDVCIPGEDTYKLALSEGVGVSQNFNVFENDSYEWISEFSSKMELPTDVISVDQFFKATVPFDQKSGRKWVDFFPLDSEIGGLRSKLSEKGNLELEWEGLGYNSHEKLSGILIFQKENGKRIGIETNLLFNGLNLGIDTDRFGAGSWLFLLMAFGGGLILNLMPCVLPVVAIKALSVTKHLGENQYRLRSLGLLFSAGIIFSFLALAILLIFLRAMGQELGWGFQFQYPSFIAGISSLIFVLALSQLGVFSLRIPSINRFPDQEEYVGSFLNGILATILSTPCTAPLLGTAMGFAFTQTATVAVGFFFCIGLGMASPHLVLSISPRLYKFLPSPGAWMDRFKQAMGFLLLTTVVWLLWVLGRQVGVDGIALTLSFLLCLGVSCWLFGLPIGLRSTKNRRLVLVISFLISVFGYVVFLRPVLYKQTEKRGDMMGEENSPWVTFSKEELHTHVSNDQIVFVDFTADWCLTCKINKQVVLERPDVMKIFSSKDVILMRADWTNRNEEITQILYSLGRSGVPAYVIFPGGEIDSPILLPEILTVGSIEDGLMKAETFSKK